METVRATLRSPSVQRAIRAAIAAGLAWQLALLLPPALSEYAYYAPLGAIIAVHPTVADTASTSWRTVLAILLGAGLAAAVAVLLGDLPDALAIALLVALAVGLEQWRVFGESASWVTVAAVFMLTIGSRDPVDFVAAYAGLVLLGATVGLLVTTALFPPLHLTRATAQIDRTRALVARRLDETAGELRAGHEPSLDDEQRRAADLHGALDRMRDAERTVERARRANPRARHREGTAQRIREESRALDRVAVLLDDVTTLVAEFHPLSRGGERPDLGTRNRLAGALEGLADVVRTPHHTADGDRPDERDRRIQEAGDALESLVERLRRTTLDEDPGFLALAAVAVGIRRALIALDAERTEPSPA
jgi:uncharacterized membrane protein YgaE (UPF0421/DUF939 family)